MKNDYLALFLVNPYKIPPTSTLTKLVLELGRVAFCLSNLIAKGHLLPFKKRKKRFPSEKYCALTEIEF